MGSPGPYLRATSLASSGGGFTTSMPCSATKTQHQGMKLNIKKKKKQQHTTTTNKLWIWIKRKLQETPAKRLKPLPPTLLHHHPAPTGTHRCPFISTSPRLHPANLAATPPQVSIPPFFVCVCVGFCLGLVPPHPPLNSEQTSFCSHCPCPHPSAPDWQGNPIPTLPAEKCLLLQQSQQKPTAKHSLLHNKSLTLSISFCSFPPFPQPSASIPSDY